VKSALALYHRLPPPLANIAASLRGYYLRSWRYGSDTEALVQAALERDHWSPTKWSAWSEQQLEMMLDRAARRVPYYMGCAPEKPADLAAWPVLKKEDVRRNPLAFVATDRNPRRLFRERTSGTTGTPLEILASRTTLHRWFAIYEARVRRWNSVAFGQRWAILGGQLVVRFERQRPPYWVYNAGLNQLYMSTHHLSAATAADYVGALRRFRPTHIVFYPSSAMVLASEILRQGLPRVQIPVCVSNAEPLSPEQREIIGEAFGGRVIETYGMGEMVAGASECERGRLHLWPEVGYLEVLRDDTDEPCSPGETGRLVWTGLLNDDMILVRYEVGDRGSRPPAAEPCPCGRKLPELGGIEGRAADMIVTADGRRIFWLNPVFYGLPLREAQIVQESFKEITVLVVPDGDISHDLEREIVQRLRARVGDVDVRVEATDHIPRTPSGKLRPVVSRLTPNGTDRSNPS
jgi:phenylacetate-CoA ligase